MFALWIYLEADNSLADLIELISWVLVPRFIVEAFVLVSLRNLCMLLEHLFVNEFAGESVPEAHHIESGDCSKQVALLLPY